MLSRYCLPRSTTQCISCKTVHGVICKKNCTVEVGKKLHLKMQFRFFPAASGFNSFDNVQRSLSRIAFYFWIIPCHYVLDMDSFFLRKCFKAILH